MKPLSQPNGNGRDKSGPYARAPHGRRGQIYRARCQLGDSSSQPAANALQCFKVEHYCVYWDKF
jgi:hypothetical protein